MLMPPEDNSDEVHITATLDAIYGEEPAGSSVDPALEQLQLQILDDENW